MIANYKLFEEIDIPGSIASTIALNAAIIGGRHLYAKKIARDAVNQAMKDTLQSPLKKTKSKKS